MGVPLESFAQLLARDDVRIDLAHACLMVAQDAYPKLDVERYLGEIERMAMRLRGRMPQTLGPEERVAALNEFLFDELGYTGNTEAYYDPRNSYLNEVMDRKIGIPISLSVLYMVVGRRVGLPLEGVSFPGHFLVRLRLRNGVLILDPFAAGAPQSVTELRERLQRVIPAGALDKAAAGDLPLEQFLEPATHRQILARVLRTSAGRLPGSEPLSNFGLDSLMALEVRRQVERELGITAHLGGENAFSYGLLYGHDACDGERLQAQAWRTWDRASRPRYRNWMY